MSWRTIQRKNFTRVQELCDFLELDDVARAKVLKTPRFPLNLPFRLAAKMGKNNLNDPLFRQFVPIKDELAVSSGFLLDPVKDASVRKERKLLHKYPGRALLLATGACAMNCRFCFRQNFEYETEQKSFENELRLIADDPSLKEIILSGGDALSLSNAVLQELTQGLSAIPHLSLLRFHTRFPLGIPERLDEDFIELLATCRLQIWFVIHCNHPLELDADVAAALRKIQKLGIPVLNQFVLLKGVNDTFPILKELHERLIECGIIPYYMHQLDRVQGAAHFEVDREEGLALIQQLRASLPGYAVPRFAVEIPGEISKTIIA